MFPFLISVVLPAHLAQDQMAICHLCFSIDEDLKILNGSSEFVLTVVTEEEYEFVIVLYYSEMIWRFAPSVLQI